jgi:hypothetical protein
LLYIDWKDEEEEEEVWFLDSFLYVYVFCDGQRLEWCRWKNATSITLEYLIFLIFVFVC